MTSHNVELPNVFKPSILDEAGKKKGYCSFCFYFQSLRVQITQGKEFTTSTAMYIFQVPQWQPDPAVVFKDICRTVIPRETVSET